MAQHIEFKLHGSGNDHISGTASLRTEVNTPSGPQLFFKRFVDQLPVFLLTGLLGVFLTAYFQYKSWRENTRLSIVNGDFDRSYTTLKDASDLYSRRYFASVNYLAALETREASEIQRVRNEYIESTREWMKTYDRIVTDLDLFIETIDGQRIVAWQDMLDKYDCGVNSEHQLPELLDELRSSKFYFTVLGNCFRKVNERLRKLRESVSAGIGAEQTEKQIAEANDALAMMNSHFNEFRSLTVDRVVRHREQRKLSTFWQFLLR